MSKLPTAAWIIHLSLHDMQCIIRKLNGDVRQKHSELYLKLKWAPKRSSISVVNCWHWCSRPISQAWWQLIPRRIRCIPGIRRGRPPYIAPRINAPGSPKYSGHYRVGLL